jgi:MurNAc alpha-1-phosphate uridylyltransferase
MSNADIRSAFILAAGLGKRMRHLRDDCPKPLMPIYGRTLLDRVLDRVEEADLKDAVVNIHYQADMMEVHLDARTEGPNISLSDESGALLETGGGIKKALNLIPSDPFFAINSDALWIDDAIENTLSAMKVAWDDDKMDVLLVMVPRDEALYFSESGDFFMDDDGLLTRRGEADTAPFVFGGIQILKKSLFGGIVESRFSLNKIYDYALQEGRAYGHYFKGTWMHIGDPEAVAAAEQYFETKK